MVPTEADEVWMNTADTSVTIGEEVTAAAHIFVLGRHAMNVNLKIQGGEFTAGQATVPGGLLFAGQYDDSHGII